MAVQSKEIIERFFNINAPFGPTAAQEEVSPESRDLFTAYFDRDNLPNQHLKRNPTMIIGRRGAGKTDALLSAFISRRRSLLIYFNSKQAAGLFSSILDQIEAEITRANTIPLVELVADLWDALFWISIAAAIVHDTAARSVDYDEKSVELDVLSDFLDGMGIGSREAASPYKIVLSAVATITQVYRQSEFHNLGIGIFRALPGLLFGPYGIDEAKLAALNWLRRSESTALLLVDSFEALDITEKANRHAIAGLIKCIGEFDRAASPAMIRCCIPAEIYHELLSLSSNALKDFQRSFAIQWSAIELLRLAAKRYALFAETYFDDQRRKTPYMRRLDDRTGVIQFWTSVLPPTVTNRVSGEPERTIPYILRHTQLLPRQLLLILNSIWAEHISRTQAPFSQVAPEIVVAQLKAVEHLLVEQALTPYEKVWPFAKNALTDVFPTLGSNILEFGELHHLFNRAPRATYGEASHFAAFLRMLIEIGAVGRVLRSSGHYVTGIFEYNEAHRLIFTDKDTLCIHPIYSNEFRVTVEGQRPASYKPVYPLGAEPEDEDRRDRFMSNYFAIR